MMKSQVQAEFQLLDNYISDFSLKVYKRTQSDENFEISANIGFAIVKINEDDMIGQIELKYNIDVVDRLSKEKNEKIAKIQLTINALFQGQKDISKDTFENMLKINGATTLSNLARAYICSATALSGMPTITLPLINFHKFFERAEKKAENKK